MQVLKLVIDDLPDYPMYVKNDFIELSNGLATMLDGHFIMDKPYEQGRSINIAITSEEMPDAQFAALEEWQP